MGCRPSSPDKSEQESAPEAPPSEIPSDPPPTKRLSTYRPSIASLHLPKDINDEASSDGISDRSMEIDETNQEFLCGTDVTLQWLLQRIADSTNKEISCEPQWISERLNQPSWEEYASSSVIRVTFGWDEDDFGLPKSVILKLPVSREQREEEEGKFHYLMFKRECNVYEWTQKYPKLPSPRMFHIKRHSKEGHGVIVMEDIADQGTQQDANKGLSVEAARELVKGLALIHATSIKHTSWATLVADLPPSYYAHMIGNFDATMQFFEQKDIDHSRFVQTASFFTMEWCHSTATESAEELGIPSVLVQGEPYASNVFMANETNEHTLTGLIDWTECHSGCFAEDLAKAICWNLSPKDRVECTGSLLEGYHYHFIRYTNGEQQLSVDLVRKLYDRFLPLAMVSLVGKVMSSHSTEDVEPLVERAKALINNVFAMSVMQEEMSGPTT